jgi:hypothetical protein
MLINIYCEWIHVILINFFNFFFKKKVLTPNLIQECFGNWMSKQNNLLKQIFLHKVFYTFNARLWYCMKCIWNFFFWLLFNGMLKCIWDFMYENLLQQIVLIKHSTCMWIHVHKLQLNINRQYVSVKPHVNFTIVNRHAMMREVV